MINSLVALLVSPFSLAVVKKKTVRTKKTTTPARKAVAPRTKAKTSGPRQKAAPAAKRPQAAQPEEKKPVVPAPILPKPTPPISAPGVFSPRSGQPVESATPVFRWFYVGGATKYEVEWSPDARFRGHTQVLTSTGTRLAVDPNHSLKPGATYAWRVRGGNAGGWGPWSQVETFRVPEE